MWGSVDGEPCSEGQSAPLQPPLPHCGSVKLSSLKRWRFVLVCFFFVCHKYLEKIDSSEVLFCGVGRKFSKLTSQSPNYECRNR